MGIFRKVDFSIFTIPTPPLKTIDEPFAKFDTTSLDSNNKHGIGIIRNVGPGNILKENSVGKLRVLIYVDVDILFLIRSSGACAGSPLRNSNLADMHRFQCSTVQAAKGSHQGRAI
jgi:hypothetical protein